MDMQGVDVRELFRLALGLQEPWRVTEVAFSEAEQRLDIMLDFPAGSRFACPECARPGCAVHDTREGTWRHLNFFQHETLLHARRPRVTCPEHGVKTVEAPWARPGSGFTLLMEAYMVLLMQNGMTARQAARMTGEYDTRLWRVLQHYVDQARERADYSEVETVGVDETSRAQGHNYVTVFADMPRKRVIFVAEGHDAETVEAFRRDLEAHGGEAERIGEVCMDMSRAYQAGFAEHFPEAQVTFDSFHVMGVLTKAVDEVRRQEQKTRPELKGTRYLWLTNTWNLSERQAERFEILRRGNLKTARACQLKDTFQDILASDTPEEAAALLNRWYFWATHSRLKPMIQAAKTLRKHRDGILRWFTSRISNGLLEGLNSLIQSAKRKARGFRSIRNLITMIYLIVGKLDLQLPSLNYATHTK